MDNVLVKRGLDFTSRKKKWIILLGLFGFSSYGAYKLYHIPSVARKRKRIMKLFGSFVSLAEMVSDSSETITLLSKELNEFLNSDSSEIPNSLKQLSKIARSDEFSDSIIRVSQSMTIGILRGHKMETTKSEIQDSNNSSFLDKVMDKVMSSEGTGFVSVIVGSFARNLVLGFYANGTQTSENENGIPNWVDLVSNDKCRLVLGESIKNFVSTAVSVYLDKTMDVNFYDEMFSGLTNPKHQTNVKEILVSLCNGVVETLVKTSHQVLTSSKSDPNKSVEDSRLKNYDKFESDSCLKDSGWVSGVTSTLAVPRNRKFVLDLTGRVTFETVRSVIEFMFLRISEFVKRSFGMIHDEVLERGFEVVRYVGSKSCVILTLCFVLLLHVLGNSRVLLPA